MFEEDDSEEDDYLDFNLKESIAKFDAYLEGGQPFYIDSDVLGMITDHYLYNGEYVKAINACEFGLKYFPGNPVFILRLSQAYSAKGMLKEALNLLNGKDKFSENLVEFYLTKASIYSQLKNSDNAIKFFKLALELAEEDERDEIYLDIAMEYQFKTNYPEAIEILKKAIQSNPRNEAALYELAFCYDISNQFEKAIQCYTEFIDENPYSFTAWYNLGNIYSKVNDLENAIRAYDYSCVINEDFSPAYFNLGNAYLSSDKYVEAEECFCRCLEIEGDDAMTHCYLAESYEQQGLLENAREHYNRAISMDASLGDAWLGLGIVCDLEGDTKKGIEFIQKAIELEPLSPSYYYVLGNALSKLEMYEEAKITYATALEIEPENEETLRDYYLLLIELEQWQEASDLLDKYEKFNDNKFTVSLLRAHWLWNNYQEDFALALLARCVAENETKSKQLFDWFEELKEEPKIITLFENI